MKSLILVLTMLVLAGGGVFAKNFIAKRTMITVTNYKVNETDPTCIPCALGQPADTDCVTDDSSQIRCQCTLQGGGTAQFGTLPTSEGCLDLWQPAN